MNRILARSFAANVLLSTAILVGGCASVPKEAVELSYQMGQDLSEMHRSYDALVAARFAEFRAKRIAYLENEWNPIFLADWVKEGMLVETAKGEVVWSDAQNDFVAPTEGQEQQQMLATVREWADSAVALIDEKRAQLLEPLDQDEAAIRGDLREAFDRLERANAHITAHLNSIREVQEVQAEALDKLGLTEVVEKLDRAIVEISDKAEQGLQEIRKADGTLEGAVEMGNAFIEHVRGGN